ncbi:hypothetical protein EON65_15970 [archaeon]|nr:MAG: hypothetical protein EON65_15970 [archaeon]
MGENFVLRGAKWNNKKFQEANIVLHIGPHKTATTHIQQTFAKYQQELSDAGYCWQGNGFKKEHHNLAVHLYFNRTHRLPEHQYMFDCLEIGQKLLISSETFAIFANQGSFNTLKQYFHPRKIAIVAAYREPLSLFYSIYTEVNKNKDYATSFGDFILHYYKKYADAYRYALLMNYEKQFGRDSIVIIDYNGVKAANQDIAHVFLCDVLRILCDVKITTNLIDNRHPSMLPHNVFQMVRTYLRSHDCSFHPSFNLVRTLQLINSYSNLVPILPTVRSSAVMLYDLSVRLDQELRSRYADILLYNNRTAALESMDKFSMVELDQAAFLTSKRWTSWLRHQAKRLIEKEIIVNCTIIPS